MDDERAGRTVLYVAGMSAPEVARHVALTLSRVAGVHTVKIEPGEGVAIVTHDPALRPANLVDALLGAGYECSREA